MKRAAWILCAISLASTDSLAIVPDAPDSIYKEVGQMGNVVNTVFQQVATGIAVSPDWVLTAAHVSGNFFKQDGAVYPILQRINHTGTAGINADFALCRVAGPMRFAAPMAFRPFSGAGGLQGVTAHIVGFGQTGTLTPPAWLLTPNTSGVRRISNNVIDWLEPAVFVASINRTTDYLIYDLDDPTGQSPVNQFGGPAILGEGGMCPGDSGGGWFIDDSGRRRLVGINSIVGRYDAGTNAHAWGGVGGAGHMTVYSGWILANITDLGRTILETLSMEGGTVTAGGLPQLHASDDQRMNISSPNLTAVDVEFPWGAVLTGTTTASPASFLDLRIEGRSNSAGSPTQVALKNWSTGFFEVVGVPILNGFETTHVIPNVPAQNYVRSDGKVEAQVRAFLSADELIFLTAEIDYFRIDVR